ncbi:MAG TPA: hypothetical protein DEP23_13845, partial [Ruminococcaceae bacterium]|nr:hypothetical protein [Oscillospiraceae bacterium]
PWNDFKLIEVVPRLPFQAAFKVSDEVLMRAVKGTAAVRVICFTLWSYIAVISCNFVATGAYLL